MKKNCKQFSEAKSVQENVKINKWIKIWKQGVEKIISERTFLTIPKYFTHLGNTILYCIFVKEKADKMKYLIK